AKCSIYAWSLMSNHAHILFKSGEKGISSVMRKLLTWYAIYFNRRHKRTGHLFENRYKSVLCEEDRYFLALIRYIHLNPVRAGIIKKMEELDSYPWSGHSSIMGNIKYKWMDREYVLARFGVSRNRAKKEYRAFMEEGMNMGHSSEFSGGGLIRSHGGWAQVVSMRRRGKELEFDERILGGSDFVQKVLEEAEERELRQLRIRKSGIGIADIIGQECTKFQVSAAELSNGSRRRKVSKARAAIARRSAEELGITAAEIARHLGVNTSAITKAITRL
ncbi:MAG: transposase, partial [Nitrospirota bacterium]